MQFPTFSFTLFFLAVLSVWWSLPARSPVLRATVLVASSLFFYAWLDPRWALALVALASAAWGFSRWVSAADGLSRRRRGWVSVLAVVSVLVVWKYGPWAVLGHNALSDYWGIAPWELPEWAYPAGLSFFTFHALSLVLSVWHRQSCPPSWLCTLAHVSFFPTLLAGPVLKADQIVPRLSQSFVWRDVAWLEGIVRVMVGMSFKWVLAPQAAAWADPAFQGLALGRGDVWWGVHAYAAQIFFDFAGYSYMAIGLAMMLGFSLTENFTQPYTATSVQEFWRRWHRSLSFFFRDHLYIGAFGGNRHGPKMALAAAAATMVVSGLWHGASVLFLIWGAWHAAALVGERLLPARASWPAWLGWACTLELVAWGWVWFRSDTLESAWMLFSHGWGASPLPNTLGLGVEALVWASAMALVIGTERWWSEKLLAWSRTFDAAGPLLFRSMIPIALSGWAFCIILLGPVGVPAFIYNGF